LFETKVATSVLFSDRWDYRVVPVKGGKGGVILHRSYTLQILSGGVVTIVTILCHEWFKDSDTMLRNGRIATDWLDTKVFAYHSSYHGFGMFSSSTWLSNKHIYESSGINGYTSRELTESGRQELTSLVTVLMELGDFSCGIHRREQQAGRNIFGQTTGLRRGCSFVLDKDLIKYVIGLHCLLTAIAGTALACSLYQSEFRSVNRLRQAVSTLNVSGISDMYPDVSHLSFNPGRSAPYTLVDFERIVSVSKSAESLKARLTNYGISLAVANCDINIIGNLNKVCGLVSLAASHNLLVIGCSNFLGAGDDSASMYAEASDVESEYKLVALGIMAMRGSSVMKSELVWRNQVKSVPWIDSLTTLEEILKVMVKEESDRSCNISEARMVKVVNDTLYTVEQLRANHYNAWMCKSI